MQTIVSADLSPRLRLAITRTARRLRQEADAGLSPSLTAALSTLERHGPLTPSRLAEIERIQRPTATRLVAKLEEQGLVEREPDPEDGRVCHVAVTREGRELVKRMRNRKNAFLSKRLRNLHEDDLRTLERATAILEAILEDPE
ncbi:MAG TPA: MarR family transcriptional regulator [Thermoleophilaceae bacterium]|jgi:DNA-binding MarR family transcriptional regulator